MPLVMKEMPESLAARFGRLRDHMQTDDFLANRGLGNEVGFFTFCYDPALELHLRDHVRKLVEDSQAGRLACRIVYRDLYDLMLQICEEQGILDAIPKQEQKRGTKPLLKLLQNTASPEAFARAVDYEDHKQGDVVVVTGAGEVYPVLRIHSLLENMHALLDDVPVIVFYPGSYDGQQFRLFGAGELQSENYYRAFDLSTLE